MQVHIGEAVSLTHPLVHSCLPLRSRVSDPSQMPEAPFVPQNFTVKPVVTEVRRSLAGRLVVGWWPHGWSRWEAEWGWEGSAALLRCNFTLFFLQSTTVQKERKTQVSSLWSRGPPRPWVQTQGSLYRSKKQLWAGCPCLNLLGKPSPASSAVVGTELTHPVSTLGAGRCSLTLPAALRCALTSPSSFSRSRAVECLAHTHVSGNWGG